MYALAHYKSIDRLRKLALKCLVIALSRIHPIEPDSHLSLDIVDLATYVYTNTDHLSRSEEPLRKLVSQFSAWNLPALETREEVVELIGEGGDFAKDVIAKVCRRLRVIEAAVSDSRSRFISDLCVGTHLYLGCL